MDSLGDRMKGYEAVPDLYLTQRMPLILRIDGRAFHTWTRGLEKPYCEPLVKIMQETTAYLVSNIGTCQLGYVQSDEISLLLHSYKKIESQPFFKNRLQKIVSIAASMATYFFNTNHSIESKHGVPALFDCRAFVIPENEINNYFIWRQNDCTRNSIQGLGQANFSHKQLQGKKNSEVQDMLIEKGINWNDMSTVHKRGTCVIRNERGVTIDTEIPIFSKNPEYVREAFVFTSEKE